MASMFKKAVKGLKPLRLVIGGASGSGKSFTALEFASYLETLSGKPTVALDTEHGRLSLYADKFAFDVLEVDPPFHPNRIIEVIKEAAKQGSGQLIVDSTTPLLERQWRFARDCQRYREDSVQRK